MTHKARLAQLEKRTQPGTNTQRLSDAIYTRAMDTLAAALSQMTGEPMTGAEVEKALQELKQ